MGVIMRYKQVIIFSIKFLSAKLDIKLQKVVLFCLSFDRNKEWATLNLSSEGRLSVNYFNLHSWQNNDGEEIAGGGHCINIVFQKERRNIKKQLRRFYIWSTYIQLWIAHRLFWNFKQDFRFEIFEDFIFGNLQFLEQHLCLSERNCCERTRFRGEDSTHERILFPLVITDRNLITFIQIMQLQ